jgi:hypothetical protein
MAGCRRASSSSWTADRVGWTDNMPADAGQASLVSTSTSTAACCQPHRRQRRPRKTNRPHGTVREELLATVLHELTHIYDRARLWPSAERR